jgi:hypothetical protein
MKHIAVYTCAIIWLAHICYDPTFLVPAKWQHGPDLHSVPAAWTGWALILFTVFFSKQLIVIFLLINNGLTQKSVTEIFVGAKTENK